MITNHAKLVLGGACNEYNRRRSSGISDNEARQFLDPSKAATIIGVTCDETFYEAIMELGDKKYIQRFLDCSFILQNKGIALFENDFNDGGHTVQNINFNVQNANAPFAATMNANTISSSVQILNTADALKEIEKLIQTKPASDREALIEILQTLRETEASDAPVSKGLLVKFSDVLKKHTDLIVPLGTALVNILSSAGK